MGTLSNYATSKLIDHVFTTAYTPASTLYFALCTTTPTASDTGSTIVETDYAGYARTSFDATLFGAASSRNITQVIDLTLPSATGASSSDINSWAILDASSLGNMLAFGAFTTAWNVVSGNTPKIPSGQIIVTVNASSGAGFTNTAAHLMLDMMFRNVAWTKPDIYAGLATATLTDSDTTATEPVGNNYARVNVPTTSMNAATNGATTNNTDITYPTPSATWGTITTIPVFDALTDGNMLAYDNDNVIDQTVNANDTVTISAGNFSASLS